MLKSFAWSYNYNEMLDPDMSSTLEPVGGFTTNVLYEESENGKSITYYLPCYLRFKIKNFVDVSLDGLNA